MYKYLITDPKYYSNDSTKFRITLEKALLKHNPDIVCFRDKTSDNFEQLAKIFLDTCRVHNIKRILINSNIKLANKLGFDGVHLTSNQFDEIQKAQKFDLFIIISCHSEDELDIAQANGASIATYSPIFDTPKVAVRGCDGKLSLVNKGKPCGVIELNNIAQKYNIPIIALGGIVDDSHIKQIAKTKAIGFASIRYFIK